MNKILLAIVALVLVGGVGYFVVMQMQSSQTVPTNETAMQGNTQGAKATIEIKDFKHSPATLTVKPGETVWVTNKDLPGHSVTSDDSSSFDTGVISQGQTTSFTAPMTPGTYGYHCTPHPSMKGTLIVQ